MADTNNFSQNKQRAIEQMREMNKRAKQPCSSAEHQECSEKKPAQNTEFGINIPSDTLIILGLILILSNENCDKLLLLALLYILI